MYIVYVDAVERTPVNMGSLSINFEKNEDNGALFFRKNLSDSLIFSNADYEYFTAISDICQEITISIDQLCEGGVQTIFEGVTAITKCSFNPDRCSVSVEVTPDDEYNCILDNIDKEVNILQEPNRQDGLQISNFQDFQFLITNNALATLGWDNVGGVGSPFTSATGEKFYVWARKIITSNCVAGVPQTPETDASGITWALLVDACGATGTSTFYRTLTAAEKTNISTNLAWTEDVVPNCPPAAAAPVSSFFIGTLTQTTSCVNAYINNSAETVTNIQNGRNLTDVIDFILSENGCTQSLLSDFFTNVTNPVTAQNPSTTNELILYEKSDVVRPTATEKASKSLVTFGQLMDDLKTLFNVRWNVSGTDLIVEHISDLVQIVGLDLTTYEGGKWIEYKNTFDYLDAEIPTEETFKFPIDTVGIDFAGYPIGYSSICSTLNESIHQTQLIETEFSRIFENDEEGLDGLVLVAPFTLNATGVFSSKAENGRITNRFQPNAPLGFGALIPDYHTWDRPLPSGDINNVLTVMDSTMPLKQQQELKFPFCCLNDFDPIKKVTTDLGDGDVIDASYNLKTKSLTLTLGFEL